MIRARFWERHTLDELTPEEWEALCDGCGKCCLHKLIDEDTDEVYKTDVACHLLDLKTAQCSDYPNRKARVPDCIQLTAETVGAYEWLPSTCAYRLVAAGEPLPWWHHLISGSRQTVHEAGMSVRGRAVSEADVPLAEMVDHIVGDD